MKAMRAEVARLIAEEVPVARTAGRPPGNESATHITGKRDSTAIVARLKRDDPELAERVVNGEMTANAAAREVTGEA